MRSSNTETAAPRRWLWAAVGLGLWGISTVGVVALYDRLFRTEQPPTQVVKTIRERPVIRVESAGSEARESVRPDSEAAEAAPAPVTPEEQSDLGDEEADPTLREVQRRNRFERVLQDFESRTYTGGERSREVALQSAIDRGLAELPAADGIRRGDVVCRGAECSMPISFGPTSDFPGFNATLKQATATDALKDEASGRRPLRSLHTYADGGQVVGRYYFRWPEP